MDTARNAIGRMTAAQGLSGAQEVQDSEMQYVLRRLEDKAAALDGLIGSLHERLQPALKPEPPQTTGERPVERAVSAPLAMALQHHAHRLDACAHLVDSLLSRLAL